MDLMGLLDQFAGYLGKNVRLRFLIWLFAVPFGILAFMTLFIKSDFFSGLITSVPGLCLLVLLVGLYFFPAIKAYQEKKGNKQAILVLNIFLGWTLVGWVVALVWAYTKTDAPSAPAVVAISPALCSSCGKYSRGDAAFCAQCGKKLS
jgi:ABC-type amino acid transport system permease subunit